MKKILQNQHEKMEEIDYDLDMGDWVDSTTRRLICHVLSFMPDKVVTYVIENVFFDSVGKDCYAHTLNLKDQAYNSRKNFIIFFDSVFLKEPKKKKLYIIAHEIGHAYLKHKIFRKSNKNEKEANMFAEKYGFKFET